MAVDWGLKARAYLASLPWDGLGCGGLPEAVTRFRPDAEGPARAAARMAAGWDALLERPGSWAEFWRQPLLVHPLAGGTRGLPVAGGARARLGEAVAGTVGQLLGRGGEEKELFLRLWRQLPDEAARADPELGAVLRVFPADPVLPGQSMWDRAALASALASSWDGEGFRPAVALFNLASAHEFVQTARRTQDFWMGSFLLSYLAWVAMQVVASSFGPDCILFPALREQPLADRWLRARGVEVPPISPELLRIASLPNVFTAVVPAAGAGQRSAAEKAVKALLGARDGIFRATRKYVEQAAKNAPGWDLAGDPDWGAIWERQRSGFLAGEVFWTELPWPEVSPGDEAGALQSLMERYAELLGPAPSGPYASLEKLRSAAAESGGLAANGGMLYPLVAALAARWQAGRKGLRHFGQSPQGEPGEKCSLCGCREALHPHWNSGQRHPQLRTFWSKLAEVKGEERGEERHKLAGRIRRGDRLCSACLTKRLAMEAFFCGKLGMDYHLFPSTASVAVAGFKEGVLRVLGGDRRLLEAVDRYTHSMFSILKRAGIHYPSAPLPRLARLAQEAGEGLGAEAKGTLRDFVALDGEWLYEESLDAGKIQRQDRVEIPEGDLQEARRALERLLAECSRVDRDLVERGKGPAIGRPSRYLAVLSLDGDHISRWVAGTRLPPLALALHPAARQEPGCIPPEVRRPAGAGPQAFLSSVLRDFSLRVVPRVAEGAHLGRVVYAGGDDVLVLAPADQALSIARDLQLLFRGDRLELDLGGGEAIASAEGYVELTLAGGQRELFPAMGTSPVPEQAASASAGVVIMHHSHPLAAGLRRADEALKESAKKGMGRDAFAVRVEPRAGAVLEVAGKWQYRGLRDGVDTVPLVEKARDLFRRGLSPRVAYHLQEELDGLWGAAVGPPASAEPVRARLRWLLHRHAEGLKGGGPDLAALAEGMGLLAEQGVTAGVAFLAEQGVTAAGGDGAVPLVELLLLARFVAGEGV